MQMKGLDAVWKKTWDRLKKNKYVLALILVGTVLLLLPSGSGSGENSAADSYALERVEFSLAAQEAQLAALLSRVEGAGETEVMLTLKTSTEQILAQDTVSANRGGDGETEIENAISTVVISGGSGPESTVTLKYIYPEYQGAVVVAQGAGDASVRLALTRAVAAATGLSSDRITVVKMKNT